MMRPNIRRPGRVLAVLVVGALVALAGTANLPGADDDPDTREADVALDILNVVIDAPWRVEVRPGRPTAVPILFYFPDTRKKFRRVRIERMALFDASLGGVGEEPGVLLYEDGRGRGPRTGDSPSGLSGGSIVLVDALGRTSTDLRVISPVEPPAGSHAAFEVSEIHDGNRAWHVIMRLAIPESRRRTIVLVGQVDYRRLDEPDERTYTIRRRLSVEVDPDPMPLFDGWRAFDAHVHSIAEFISDTSIRALRRNFGGPVRMIQESAAAMGLIDSPEAIRDNLVVTDHNCYFSDRDFPKAGPTIEGILPGPIHLDHPEWSVYFRDRKGRLVEEGQKEFENYVSIFGITQGEELSLAKSPGGLLTPLGSLAAHMLVYSTRHFMGPFHGGRFLLWPTEVNPNSLSRVLEAMASDPHFPRGFAYAAHPFTQNAMEKRIGTAWNDQQLEEAVRGPYIRREGGRDRDFVFKGFQLWNQKDSRALSASIGNPPWIRHLLEDPAAEPAWNRGSPNWDSSLVFGLHRWHRFLSGGLAHRLPGRDGVVTVRKLFIAGGSDAHVDFNRSSDIAGRGFYALPNLIHRLLKFFTISDNAFARVRTAVDPSGIHAGEGHTSQERMLRAYARGQGIVTDGPVVEFRIDADGHFNSQTHEWHEDLRYEDDDGMMGGAGAMDGGRTALVPAPTASALLRFRYRGSPSFGGDPVRIELYVDGPGAPTPMVTVERNTGPALGLAPAGLLAPSTPADPGGWRVTPLADVPRDTTGGRTALGPVTAPCVLSLGAFTLRSGEPPFDFRCYTNPIWLLPVRALARVLGRPGAASGLEAGERRSGRPAPSLQTPDSGLRSGSGTVPASGLAITVRFPVSMSPRRIECRLVPRRARGPARAADGIPLEPVPAGAWRPNPRTGAIDADYTVTNAGGPIDLSSGPGGFLLVLSDPHDTHGNRLNEVALPIDLSTPTPAGEPDARGSPDRH